MQLINIGTQQVPLPLHVKVVPISIALNDHLWDEASLTVIRRKKVHMKKALVDYPANKRARTGAGKYTIKYDAEICMPIIVKSSSYNYSIVFWLYNNCSQRCDIIFHHLACRSSNKSSGTLAKWKILNARNHTRMSLRMVQWVEISGQRRQAQCKSMEPV